MSPGEILQSVNVTRAEMSCQGMKCRSVQGEDTYFMISLCFRLGRFGVKRMITVSLQKRKIIIREGCDVEH